MEITKYAGNSATYVIPDEIDGKSVTKIGHYVFSDCTELTSVFIPKSVNCIESSSFSDDSLNYIEVDSDNKTYSSADGVLYSKDKATLVRYPQGKKDTTFEVPATVSVIDFGAFSSNKYIKDVILPENLTSIDNSSFYKCASIVSIAIPENVSSIGNYAFAECDSLKYADIPANVSIIGASPFRNCQSLENIKVDEANKWFTSEDGVLYNKVKTQLINYPAGKKDSSYVIPEGIRIIRDSAFSGSLNLCELTIPDSVYEIENSAFYNSSLISNEYDTIEYVDGWVVDSGHTANVVLKDGTRGIATGAFCFDQTITKISMPDTVKHISSNAFQDCYNLSEVLLSSSLENIEQFAFYNCIDLSAISIPDSVTRIESNAFSNTALLSNQLTPVKYADTWVIACEECEKATIKDGTKGIANYAFANCSSLTEVTIPDSVTKLGNYAFINCINLQNIIIPNGVTAIPEYAFYSCSNLTSVTIPDSVKTIGANAFYECVNLTSITIPYGVTRIPENAFCDCYNLTNVAMPDTITSIGEFAFVNCTKLTNVIIPDNVISIGEFAFFNCSELINVTIPNSVTSIDTYALGFCNYGDKIDGFKIYCYKDTAGEQYAKDCGFDYEILDGETQCTHSNTEIRNAKSADCTTDGYTGDTYCVDCDELISSGEVIPATGHTEVIDEAVEATCTKTGLTEGSHCSVCNTVIKAQEVVPATGKHSFGNWKITKAATCTAEGTQTRTCSVCGKVETATIAKIAHKYVNTVVKPTYTAQGYTLHKCSVCGASYKDTYTAKLTLAKVTSVKLGGRAADALRVNWSKNANADGYIVEMYQGGKWVRVAKITNNSTTTFRKAGLSASTVYKFRVRAYKMSGKTAVYGAYSTELAARTNPSVIKGAKLTGRAADALRINWTKNTTADGYIVEMYQGNKWVRVAKITSNNTTTFRKAGLKAGTAYKFRVKAYKMSGKTALYGNYSATVTARTNPSVIKGAKLSGRAADALRINWAKNASADGYIVEMYQGNKWVRVAKITSNSTTTFKKAGLKASTVYKFRVRAYKMSGKTALYGNYSATVTARTNPSAVTVVKIGGTAKDALRVNWTKNASAQGYIVEMYQGGKWVRVAKIANGNTTTFRKSGLAKNTIYKFRVKAYYMSGKTALYGGYGSVSGKTAAK